jgi:hypothetical protein|tara:strand:- start:497 stop:1114 length:618 start_codon:yes stop_codon:yes gene_type:complete
MLIEDESAALMVVPLNVRPPATTLPVPPGVKLISAFELDPIVLSLNVKLSIVVVPTKLVVLVTLKVERVVSPDGTARVELKFVAPESVAVPETFSAPSTISPSLMLIDDESLELKVVPFTMNSPRLIFPVPDVVSVRSPLLGADIVEPFTRISPSVFNVSAYERLVQAADPSPILNLFESDSQPNSPAASVGLLLVQSAAVSLRS